MSLPSTPVRNASQPFSHSTTTHKSTKHIRKSSRQRLALPKLLIAPFQRRRSEGSPAESSAASSFSWSRRSSRTHSLVSTSPSDSGMISQTRQESAPQDGTRRRSSVGELVSHAAHKIVQLHRIALGHRGDRTDIEDNVEVTWTDKYRIDVPPYISQDQSELDYLRRTNLEAAMGVLSREASRDDNDETISVVEADSEITPVRGEETHEETSCQRVRFSMPDEEPAQVCEEPVEVEEELPREGTSTATCEELCLPPETTTEKLYRFRKRNEDQQMDVVTAINQLQLQERVEARKKARAITESRKGFLPPF